LLINKLHFCGILDNVLNLIKSFISNRPQQVWLNGLFSGDNTNCFSVSQGTVLSPVLFIIYINRLLNLNLDADTLYYADDTVILVKNINYNNLF